MSIWRFYPFGDVFVDEDDNFLYIDDQNNCNQYSVHTNAFGKKEFIRYDTSPCSDDYVESLEHAEFEISREIVLVEIRRYIQIQAKKEFIVDFDNYEVIPVSQEAKEAVHFDDDTSELWYVYRDLDNSLEDYADIQALEYDEPLSKY